jgi:hypothetical protein
VSGCTCVCHGGGPYAVCDVTDGYDGGCGHLHTDTPDDVDTQRRCARGTRCADRSPERDPNGKPTGAMLAAPITTDRGLCTGCVRDVTHALGHLTGDVVELTMLLGRVGMSAEVVVSSSPDLQIPIRVNVEALRAQIDSELQAWAEPVAEQLGIEWDTTAVHRTRMGPRVQRAAHLLTRSVDTLLALPPQEHPAWVDGEPAWDIELDCQDTVIRDGVDAGITLIDLHRLAYAALGRTKLVHRLPAPCPWCDRVSLVRHNGSDHVECEHCHRKIDQRHYDWLVAVVLREQERLRQEREEAELAEASASA